MALGVFWGFFGAFFLVPRSLSLWIWILGLDLDLDLGLRFPGSVVDDGEMGTWGHGEMGLGLGGGWGDGDMEIWNGDMKTWRHEDLKK